MTRTRLTAQHAIAVYAILNAVWSAEYLSSGEASWSPR